MWKFEFLFAGETRKTWDEALFSHISSDRGCDGWFGAHYSPGSVRPQLALLKQHAEAAGRDFSRLEITVGLSPGVRPDLDTVRSFADAGVHRMVVFAPGFVPRSRFQSDLFPTLERFATEVIAKA